MMAQPTPLVLAALCVTVACAVESGKATDTVRVETLSQATPRVDSSTPVTLNVDRSTSLKSRIASKDPEVAAIARADSTRVIQIARGDTLRFAGMTLSEYGIGPLRIGMTVAEAAAALGGGFADSDAGIPPMCTQAVITSAPLGFGVLLENGKVAVIYVDGDSIAAYSGGHTIAASGVRSIATASGVRIGDPVAKIRPLYPGSRAVTHTNEDSGGDSYTLAITPGNDTTSRYRIVFETDGKVVTGFRAGVVPVVEYVEGCG
jgi:hypothetical protein